jgi:hypothetical protein
MDKVYKPKVSELLCCVGTKFLKAITKQLCLLAASLLIFFFFFFAYSLALNIKATFPRNIC